VASVTRSPSTGSACFFAMSRLSANSAARCLSVTVACTAAFAGAAFDQGGGLLGCGRSFLGRRHDNLPGLLRGDQIDRPGVEQLVCRQRRHAVVVDGSGPVVPTVSATVRSPYRLGTMGMSVWDRLGHRHPDDYPGRFRSQFEGQSSDIEKRRPARLAARYIPRW
jgi:hypothetical protein